MMGVYHLMGVGTSPGAVTGPLSLLKRRYERWNSEDREFFGRSGERAERAGGERVGDVEGIILFSTGEVLSGDLASCPYVDNRPGTTRGRRRNRGGEESVPGVVARYVENELRDVWGAVPLYGCEVFRRALDATYERVLRVVAALAGVGGQGKEMWINLTGGTNVMNLALGLTSRLSGKVARNYYVQAQDRAAEKCLRYTAEEGYWVELPVLPLSLPATTTAVISLLDSEGPLAAKELYSRMRGGRHYHLIADIEAKRFRDLVLGPLWKQGLIEETDPETYRIGSRWHAIRPYQETLRSAVEDPETLTEMVENQSWVLEISAGRSGGPIR